MREALETVAIYALVAVAMAAVVAWWLVFSAVLLPFYVWEFFHDHR